MTTNLPKTLASLQAHGFQTLTPEQAVEIVFRPEFALAFRLEQNNNQTIGASKECLHIVTGAFKHMVVPVESNSIVSLGFCGSSIIINQKAFSVTDFLKDPCSIIKNIAQ